tara:strand:+ start:125 stop:610 length:486 start_codon:yes stop_codon:yes gene_type:complete
MERIQKQIHDQFHTAFYDSIHQAIATDDHEYIVRLYTEIRDRLAAFVKIDGQTYQQIREEFDVPFFEQLITHKQFDGNSMPGLVNTTFKWIHDLQMPLRDTSTEEARKRVLAAGQGTMADVVTMYIKEVHQTIDLIEKDMKEFVENQDHPVVQEMLKQQIN